MNKYFETELGHYLSAFFFMKINTDEELDDFSKLRTDTESTFIHEYIHFLQDISTSYGLLTISHIIDIILSITKNIYLSGEQNFKVPIVLTDDTEVGKVMDILSVIYGDKNLSQEVLSISSINLIKEDYIKDIELFHIELKCKTNSRDDCYLLFGSLCLIEGMAYHISNFLYPNINNPPQFPYKICDLIIKHKYPILLENELNIIAVCDISLNSYNPGRFFIEALDHMIERKFTPHEPKEIYDFLLRFGYPKENGEVLSIIDLYNHIHTKCLKQIELLLYDPVFLPVKNWTIDLIKKAREKRKAEFSFLIEILTGEKSAVKAKLFMLIEELGVPLMSNKNDSFCFPNKSANVFNQIPIYRAIFELHNILADRQKDCKLIKLCKPTGIVNSDCTLQPWNWSTKDKKCTFGAAWTLYGLQGKVPVFNK